MSLDNPFAGRKPQLGQASSSRINGRLGTEGQRLRQRLEKGTGQIRKVEDVSDQTDFSLPADIQKRSEALEEGRRLFDTARQTIEQISDDAPVYQQQTRLELLEGLSAVKFPYQDVLAVIIAQDLAADDPGKHSMIAYLMIGDVKQAHRITRTAIERRSSPTERYQLRLMLDAAELTSAVHLDKPTAHRREIIERLEATLTKNTRTMTEEDLYALEDLLEHYVGTMSDDVYIHLMAALERYRQTLTKPQHIETIYKFMALLNLKKGHLGEAEHALSFIAHKELRQTVCLTIAEHPDVADDKRKKMLLQLAPSIENVSSYKKLVDIALQHPGARELLRRFEASFDAPLRLNEIVKLQIIMNGFHGLGFKNEADLCYHEIKNSFEITSLMATVQEGNHPDDYVVAGCAVIRACVLVGKDPSTTINRLLSSIFITNGSITPYILRVWTPDMFIPLINVMVECDIDPSRLFVLLNGLVDSGGDHLLRVIAGGQINWATKRTKQLLHDSPVYAAI